jgi:short-subunit dehydrogenase
MDKKIAFISGGTSGLGAAFARHFAQQGYNLIVTGHPDDKISLDTEELKSKNNVNVEVILTDLANENEIASIEDIIKRNNDIEVLINNAGFFFGKPFWQKDIPDLEGMVKVHICVPVRFILAALPGMTGNRKGVIINMSSLVSFMPVPQDAMYSSTKLFNNSFMESLHISFRDKGIKVQVLCPGFIRNTHFHERAGIKTGDLKNWKLLPWMDPEKVVSISVRNLKKKNKVVVIPGWRNRVIRFLATIVPRPLYYRFATRFLQ